MKNHVSVMLGGQNYTLVGAEDDEYIKRVASHVNSELDRVMDDGRISLSDAGLLTAMNIADQYFKELEIADNLRHQLKAYLDESARMKQELSESKREIFKLQNEKK
ncbi:MAG: cell division protein ZapA [Evtepia sp.]